MYQTYQGTYPSPIPPPIPPNSPRPSFGASYNPVSDPPNTRYYLDVFMSLFRGLSLGPIHILCHHTGAGLAIEAAAVYPSEILSIALSRPAFMTSAEQDAAYRLLCTGPFSKPEADGSHLARVLKRIDNELMSILDVRMGKCMDNWKAWKGKYQAYKCMFKQDKSGYYKQVTCLVLGMCSEGDMLWSYFHYVKEIVSSIYFSSEE